MQSQPESASLRRELETHRRNLGKLREQAALYGKLDVPLKLENAIRLEEEAIAQIDAQLEGDDEWRSVPIEVPKVRVQKEERVFKLFGLIPLWSTSVVISQTTLSLILLLGCGILSLSIGRFVLLQGGAANVRPTQTLRAATLQAATLQAATLQAGVFRAATSRAATAQAAKTVAAAPTIAARKIPTLTEAARRTEGARLSNLILTQFPGPTPRRQTVTPTR